MLEDGEKSRIGRLEIKTASRTQASRMLASRQRSTISPVRRSRLDCGASRRCGSGRRRHPASLRPCIARSPSSGGDRAGPRDDLFGDEFPSYRLCVDRYGSTLLLVTNLSPVLISAGRVRPPEILNIAISMTV